MKIVLFFILITLGFLFLNCPNTHGSEEPEKRKDYKLHEKHPEEHLEAPKTPNHKDRSLSPKEVPLKKPVLATELYDEFPDKYKDLPPSDED